MEGEKPQTLLKFAKKNKLGFLSLEYSGHGKSSGKFLKGNRPSFVNAKSSEIAEEMILKIVEEFSKHVTVKTGSFGAMMDVGLVNDGPATFVLTARNGQLIDQAD